MLLLSWCILFIKLLITLYCLCCYVIICRKTKKDGHIHLVKWLVKISLISQVSAGITYPLPRSRRSGRCLWAGPPFMLWMKTVSPTHFFFCCWYIYLNQAVGESVWRERYSSRQLSVCHREHRAWEADLCPVKCALGVCVSGNLWYRQGLTPSYPQGSAWELISGNACKVSVGPLDQVWNLLLPGKTTNEHFTLNRQKNFKII